MPLAGKQRGVVVITGATGIGKTALAVALVQHLPVEIVSADSRQIYRHMDIATAKPTPAERAAVPHHLIDIVNPDEVLTLAGYQAAAYAALDAIYGRGLIPLLVGGTGQYLAAVMEGWSAPDVPPNAELRAEFEAQIAAGEGAALVARLHQLDPQAAAFIDPRNLRRVIRALEVTLLTGQPFSAQRGKTPPPYSFLKLALTGDRESLYNRLDSRIEGMIAAGLVEEVRYLHECGYGWSLPAMSGLGYAQLGAHLRGELSLAEAVSRFKYDTHDFVRRQYTWFRRYADLIWLESPQAGAVALQVREWAAGLA